MCLQSFIYSYTCTPLFVGFNHSFALLIDAHFYDTLRNILSQAIIQHAGHGFRAFYSSESTLTFSYGI